MSTQKKYAGLCVGGPNDGNILSSDFQRVTVPDLDVPGPGIGMGTYSWHEGKGVWIYSFGETSKTDGSA